MIAIFPRRLALSSGHSSRSFPCVRTVDRGDQSKAKWLAVVAVMIGICRYPAGAQAVTPTIRVSGISSAGLELAGPNSRGFDERVRRLAPSVGDAVLLCKPQLAILSNHSKKTAVAYAVRFVVTHRRGEQDRLTSQRKYPNAIAGTAGSPSPFRRGLEIRPGEERIVTREMAISPELTDDSNVVRYCRSETAAFVDVNEILIDLDATVFDDGSVVGANLSRIDQHFVAYVEALQATYRTVVQRLDSGMTFEEVLVG